MAALGKPTLSEVDDFPDQIPIGDMKAALEKFRELRQRDGDE
jgi:hypothetical protein